MKMKKTLITICIATSFLFAASLFLHTNLFSYLYEKLYGYWSLVIIAVSYCSIAYSTAKIIYYAGRYAGYKKCMLEMLESVEEAREALEKNANSLDENIDKSKTLLTNMNNTISDLTEIKNKYSNLKP